jgi:hypothetical protein
MRLSDRLLLKPNTVISAAGSAVPLHPGIYCQLHLACLDRLLGRWRATHCSGNDSSVAQLAVYGAMYRAALDGRRNGFQELKSLVAEHRGDEDWFALPQPHYMSAPSHVGSTTRHCKAPSHPGYHSTSLVGRLYDVCCQLMEAAPVSEHSAGAGEDGRLLTLTLTGELSSTWPGVKRATGSLAAANDHFAAHEKQYLQLADALVNAYTTHRASATTATLAPPTSGAKAKAKASAKTNSNSNSSRNNSSNSNSSSNSNNNSNNNSNSSSSDSGSSSSSRQLHCPVLVLPRRMIAQDSGVGEKFVSPESGAAAAVSSAVSSAVSAAVAATTAAGGCARSETSSQTLFQSVTDILATSIADGSALPELQTCGSLGLLVGQREAEECCLQRLCIARGVHDVCCFRADNRLLAAQQASRASASASAGRAGTGPLSADNVYVDIILPILKVSWGLFADFYMENLK